MPFEIFRKKLTQEGLVLFRGTLPPRFEELDLKRLKITASNREVPNTHWAVNLRHPQWGKAVLLAPRKSMLPPPQIYEWDPRLSESDRARGRQAGCALHVITEAANAHILSDKKTLLRYLRAIMGDDGLLAIDRMSTRPWTPASLDDELEHDSDVDVDALITVHYVVDDDTSDDGGGWLHTHGLGEVGAQDFDILEPSTDILSARLYDLQRALAYHILEGNYGRSDFTLVDPGGDIRLVPIEEFNKKAADKWKSLRETRDDVHNKKRVVVCEPTGRGLLGRLAKSVRPSKFLSDAIPDGIVIRFSDASVDLMAQRARATFDVFRRATDELTEFELPCLVKLGYPTDEPPHTLEHLWFSVHECGEDWVEATLENQPHNIAAMQQGTRGRHKVERLTDWTILSPFGSINSRDLSPLRAIRERKDKLRAAMR